MTAPTHLVAGAAVAAWLSGGHPGAILAAGVGSLLPDLDHPGSAAGRRLAPASAALRLLAGHRGVWHSVWGCAGAALLARSLTLWAWPWVALGFALHLLLDGLTPAGIRPLPPLQWRVRGPVRTGSVGEFLVAAVAVCGLVLR